MRFKIVLAYDGTDFHGWAAQPGLRTVQGEIEKALATILRLHPGPTVTCAGRTDAGVHARGQVIHVDVNDAEAEYLARRLRRLVPADITIKDVTEAPAGFDARFAALERRYVYRIHDEPRAIDPLLRGSIVALPRPLDVDSMNAAAEHLLGEHDFAAFCRKREGATTIRTLLALHSARRDDGVIETTVRADAFCHSMVRALMGAIAAVGDGRYAPSWVGEILRGQRRDARVKVMPAHGLVLEEVRYPPETLLADQTRTTRRRRDEFPTLAPE